MLLTVLLGLISTLKCFSFEFHIHPDHCTVGHKSEFPAYHQDCWHRREIIEIVDRLNYTVGVEVGVQKGLFAKDVLSIWKNCKVYNLVDIWKQQTNYEDKANVNDQIQEENYQTTRENVAEFKDVPQFFRNDSLTAAKHFANESVDFVYLDARHDYCGVKEDLEAWYPKLKVGGMIAGHDFLTSMESLKQSGNTEHWNICSDGSDHPGAVKLAVVEFACKQDLVVHMTKDRPPSWYLERKPSHPKNSFENKK